MATAPAAPPVSTQINMAQVAAAYVKIRAAKSALTAEFETKVAELDGKLQQLEGVMLKHLNTHGMTSVATEGGTFYKQEDIKPSCGDWNAYYQWITENNAFEGLEKRVGKGFIKDFMEAHEGLLPPGINVHREWVVRVRKPQ
jgi:hypothetical protein